MAINNHNGHGGRWLWVVRLKDGRIIRARKVAIGSGYDRYSDYQYLPDLFDSVEARNKIAAIYGGYRSDQMRLGYTTVGYGWLKGDVLLVYHGLVFDRLVASERSSIQVVEEFKVSAHGIAVVEGSVYAKRMKLGDEGKEMPGRVKAFFE